MVSVTSGFGNQANGLLWNAKSSIAASRSSSDLPSNSNTIPVVSVLLNGAASSDNPLTQPLSDEQRQASDAIRTLHQVQKQLVDDRKSAALQKLERLREQLRILRSLGGDPKTIARQAKLIAQEIGAAATEYAAAVASEGGGDASAPADPSSTAPAGSDTGSSASGTAATAGSTPEPATSQDAPAVTGAATDATATGEKSSAAPSSNDSKADSDASPTAHATTESDTDAARQKTLKAYQDAAANTAANSARASGDRDALQQFKDAARDAKNLIEEAARKLKARKSADPDAAEAERAASGLDHDIQGLSDAIQTQQIETAEVATGAAITDASASAAINILI
jgi:hypothetical protein